MEIELHRLDLRYERLRSRNARQERQLVASLAEVGQQHPIVVIAGGDGGRHIVVDGYKRVRALRRLAHDTVLATPWELDEVEALLLERLMRTGAVEGALQQGWLLKELAGRFRLSQEDLARRFDRSPSWVSRRLALVEELPGSIQERVRAGELAAHAAMKYLVPMARANVEAAEQLAAAIAPLKATTRQVSALWAGWLGGDEKTRELILGQPAVYLRAQKHAKDESKSPAELQLSDLGALGGIARRARKRLLQGLWRQLSVSEREEATRCFEQAHTDWICLWSRYEKEVADARPEHSSGDPEAA
jgi:ParB family chromosome partitioning protein